MLDLGLDVDNVPWPSSEAAGTLCTRAASSRPESQNLLPAWLQPQGREEEEKPPGASASALPFA